ncbi:MAG: hypothetical protein ACE37N_11215 [Pseudohongiellaceae bacterium]
MKILKDFFFGDVDPWTLMIVGSLIGAVGMMFLGLTFWLAFINIRNFSAAEGGDRLVSSAYLFASAGLAYWLIGTARRAINDAGKQDDH